MAINLRKRVVDRLLDLAKDHDYQDEQQETTFARTFPRGTCLKPEQAGDHLLDVCRKALEASVRGGRAIRFRGVESKAAADTLFVTMELVNASPQSPQMIQEWSDVLSRELSEFATQAGYKVRHNRVQVAGIRIIPIQPDFSERIIVSWGANQQPVPDPGYQPFSTASHQPSTTGYQSAAVSPPPMVANQPANPETQKSGRITEYEGEKGQPAPFRLWSDIEGRVKSYDLKTDPFYFGRGVKYPQVPVPDTAGETAISADQFSIHYFPNWGFVLRDVSRNGTYVRRRVDGEERMVRLCAERLPDGKVRAKELILQDGDMLYVQSRTRQSNGQARGRMIGFLFQEQPTDQPPVLPPFHNLRTALDAREVVVADGATWINTLINGENFLGLTALGGPTISIVKRGTHFRELLASVLNFGECWLQWLHPSLAATLDNAPLTLNAPRRVINGSLLQVNNLQLVFRWDVEDDRRRGGSLPETD